MNGLIHRDLCNPMNTKNYSPLRMQFHFLLSRYVCWDGLIPLTRFEMAFLLSCDIQSIHKFIKKGIREGILSLVGERIYLLKRVEKYTEGYVKHYPFLESADFKGLSIHAQRFILYTLWAGVHTGRPLKREITTLYHSNEKQGVLNLYSRAPIYKVLEEAENFLNLEVFSAMGKEFVRVTGLKEPFATQNALHNQGEIKLLENILLEEQCDEFISESSKEEILKIKKHYVTALNSIGNELFSHALKNLFSLHKLFDLDTRGEIGVYLRSILNDLEEKILPTLRKRIDYVKQALMCSKEMISQYSSLLIQSFEKKMDELKKNVKVLLSKKHLNSSSSSPSSFPFYNWLEPEA